MATRITCPALVLHARGDARVPFEEGRRLAGLVPGARLVPLESSNHVLLAHEPPFAQCFGEIHAFLALHDGAQQSVTNFPSLTARERALLELLAQGLDNCLV